jgi:hypothetical protein
MLAPAGSRTLVTPARWAPQRSHHDWKIAQSNQALAPSRNLVTHAVHGACHGHTPYGRRAKPAREQRARGRGSTRRCLAVSAKRHGWRLCSRACSGRSSNTVDAHGCAGRDRKRDRNTSTCAVPVAPSPLLDWAEQSDPIGRTHTRWRSLKKTELNPEEDASKTPIGRKRRTKKMQVHTGQ